MDEELTVTDVSTLLFFVEEEIKQRQIQITQLQDDDSFEVTVFIGSLEKGIDMFEDLKRKLKALGEKIARNSSETPAPAGIDGEN